MEVSASTLLSQLPPYQDEWVLIKEDQKVKDIKNQIGIAHKKYAGYYDQIALYFDDNTIDEICSNLYNFCQRHIIYKEETTEDQTTSLPTGILYRGFGDCKHYASFCGGILDALNRLTDKKINWHYRFASYTVLDSTPHHVFIVVNDNGEEIWIDPVPGANDLQPIWQQDKKVKASTMALRENIAGFSETTTEETDIDVPVNVMAQIQLLFDYGILNQSGNFSESKLHSYKNTMEYEALVSAWNDIVSASKLGSLLSDIWHGIKAATLLAPRTYYKLLVSLNIFGTATKLAQAMSTPEGKKQVLDRWYSMGGNKEPGDFLNAIEAGAKKKAVLGNSTIGDGGVSVAAIVAAASAIIAALAPIINSIIAKQKVQNQIIYPDAAYGQLNPSAGSDPLSWAKNNPLPVAAGTGLALYLLTKQKGKKQSILIPVVGAAAVFFFLNNAQQMDAESKRQFLIQQNPSSAPVYQAMNITAILDAFNKVIATGIFDKKEETATNNTWV